MAKKKSWFNLLKKIFISDSESRLDKVNGFTYVIYK